MEAAVVTVMFNSILMRMVGADGVAAIVSFARTFGFLIAALALMPQHLDVDGLRLRQRRGWQHCLYCF